MVNFLLSCEVSKLEMMFLKMNSFERAGLFFILLKAFLNDSFDVVTSLNNSTGVDVTLFIPSFTLLSVTFTGSSKLNDIVTIISTL